MAAVGRIPGRSWYRPAFFNITRVEVALNGTSKFQEADPLSTGGRK